MLLPLLVLLSGPAVAQVLTPSQITISYHKPIQATSTCGELNGQPITEMYCTLAGSSFYNPLNPYSYSEEFPNPSAMQELRNARESVVQGGHGCGQCRAGVEDKEHPASNMVDGNTSWWMSPPLSRGMEYNQVNITIDLLQEFHVAYVWIQMANSPKPGTWVLERSVDFGLTWKPWYYFADSDAECMRRFGVESLAPIESDDQVICRHVILVLGSDFSSIHPLDNGELMINLMEHRPSRDSFMSSTALQDFTRATNVRLRLLGTRTLQGHLMDLNDKTDPTVTRRYFYAIKEILMGGRCVCNGHASTCDIIDQARPQTLVCRCEHNTCGDMCEQCCPGYVAKKWQKTTATNNFTCEPCQCFGRARDCEYDESLEGISLDMNLEKKGGGRCKDCQYFTKGINCNECVAGYYRPTTKQWADPYPCEPCQCDPSKHNGECAEESGKCFCQPRFMGEDCDQCAPGYHSPPECLPCDCKLPGTKDDVCTPANGTCPCHEGYSGKYCETCDEGYTNVSNVCQECGCDSRGAVHGKCDIATGECVCSRAFGGMKCGECAAGYYDFPECKFCDCDPSGTENGVCDSQSGQCLCKPGFAGRHCDQCDINFYGYPNCKACDCNGAGASSSECDAKTGQCECTANFTARTCDKCAVGFYGYPDCKECACLKTGAKGLTCDQSGQCFCKDNFDGARCDTCKPNYYNFPLCELCNCDPSGVTLDFAGCDKVAPGELCECRANVEGRICDKCKPTFWDLQYYHREGCVDCACHLPGTVSRLNTCKQRGGQCNCKRNVAGRTCDKCAHGFFDLQPFHPHGCQPCNCDVGGSLKGDCDMHTGQCNCRPRITGLACDRPLPDHYFPTLWHHQYEAEDGHSPDNRPVRFAINEQLFPDFSWRGYAVFSPIQDNILIDVDVPKSTVSRLLLRVHNPSNVTLSATVSLSPVYATPTDVEQSTKISFPPSPSPYISEVTLNGKPFVLNVGKWTLSVATKQRLFWDYVVILPSQYYEAGKLVSSHAKACEAGVKNGNICLDLLFPPLPNVARADVTKDGLVPFDITDGEGNTVPLEMVPVELVREDVGPAAFVRADNSSRTIRAKIEVPETDKYVVLIEYHNREKTVLPLGLTISQANVTQSGSVSIHYCPYATFCRELVVEDGQPLVIPLEKGSADISLSVSPNHEFGLAAVNLVREKDWSVNYLHQVPVCIRRKNLCEPLSFPPATGSVIVEAEQNQREGRPIPGDKLNFNVASPEELVVVPIDEANPNLEISGVVQMDNHYMLVVHYFNPDNTDTNVDVLISSNDHLYEATLPFTYCPSVGGCRSLLREKDRPEVIQFYLEDKYTVQIMGKNLEKLKGPIFVDSLTAVPYQYFSTNLMQPLPLDLSGDFVENCGEDYFRNDPKGKVSDECRGHIFSLTTEFNQAAFPCECNSQGSNSFTCAEYGGQCECKENVMGRRCDRCKAGHYGFPNCKKCSCGKNHQCDERTGQCFCPPHVEGINCDRCVTYAFGYDPLIGCQKCGCNPQGSENGQAVCDAESGQCLCRVHVGGRQCDTCLAGFYGFPYCHQCQCNKEGTTHAVCDVQTAKCLCKENVIGQQCEHCKHGTFALSVNHEKGCVDCFCFGVTDHCQSSFLPVVASSIDLSLVKTNDANGEVKVDGSGQVQYTAGSTKPKVVYFDIPVAKGRDYSSSYGLFLTFSVSSSPSEDGISREPDLLLKGGNYSAEFWAHEQPSNPSKPFEIRVQLSADSLLSPTGRPLSREEVMMLLYSLSSIQIKASFYTSTPSAKLIDFSLERVDETSHDYAIRAVTVEKCNCPAPYTGLSCQECAAGYYRVKTGPFLGSCVPCQCHGHSGTCDKETGLCLECQHNTMGDHCESCIEGFYGDAQSGSPFACSPCNCPYAPENNFATSCSVAEDGLVQSCTCRQGYAGDRCEKCAAGFFGDPEASGGLCEPCECNGNNDLRDPEACHYLTGHCFLCQNNTKGSKCGECADWYYGDAVKAKNCTDCGCNQCGAFRCDSDNGKCACKQNVVGDKCDRCAADHYGFSRCGGCHGCHCAAAASNTQCDDTTGQCQCRPGATGLRCEQCEYGFWNYGENGCTKCDCEADLSLGTVCDVQTGQCHCQDGATGARCDKCIKGYLRIPTMGCRRCDECVHHLKADVDSLDVSLNNLNTSISGISAATIDGARASRIVKKMSLVDQTKNLLIDLNSEEEGSRQAKAKGVLEEAARANLKAETSKKTAAENTKTMAKIGNHTYTVLLDIKERGAKGLEVVDSLRLLAHAIEASAGQPKPVDEWVEEGKRIVEEMEKQSEKTEKTDGHRNAVEKGKAAMEEVKTKQSELTKKLNEKKDKMEKVKQYTDDSLQQIVKAKAAAKSATDRVGRLQVYKTDALITSGLEDLKKREEKAVQVEELTKQVKGEAENLAELGEDVKELVKSLNETLDTLKAEKEKRMKRDADANDKTSAKTRAEELAKSSTDLQQKFSETKQASKASIQQKGLEAAAAYDDLATSLIKASEAAEKAKKTVDEETKGVDELRTRVASTRNTSMVHMANSEKLRVEGDVEVKRRLGEVEDRRKAVNRDVEALAVRLSKIGDIEALNVTMKERLQKEYESEKKAEKIEEIRQKVTELEASAKERVDSQMAGEGAVRQMRKNLEMMEGRRETAPGEWKERKEVLTNAANRVERLNEQLRKLKESLAMARDAANKVSLPAHFEMGSSMDVHLDENPSHSSVATDLSLLFRTQHDGTPLYFGNVRASDKPVPATDDFIAVTVKDGKPTVVVDLGEGRMEVPLNTRVVDNEWHRVDVSRVGRNVRATLLTPDGKITMETRDATSSGNHAVLNLQKATSKLYVGGAPPNVQIPLETRHFIGDISDVLVNGDAVGLWSTNEGGISQVTGAVKRQNDESSYEREVGLSDGFLTFRLGFWNPRRQTKLSFSFLTYAPDGLIFYLGKDKKFLSIEISSGIVKVSMDLGSGVGSLQTENTYNDGSWHSLRLVRNEKDVHLSVDGEVVQFEMKGDSKELAVSDYFYLGGLPLDVTSRSTVEPLRGCLRNVKHNDDVVNIRQAFRSKGVSASCPSVSLTREVSFLSDRSSASFVNISLSPSDRRSSLDLAFRLKTRQNNAFVAALNNDDEERVLSLWLVEGVLSVRGADEENIGGVGASIADGLWHYVSIRKDNEKLAVSIDDAYFSNLDKLEFDESPLEKYTLHFGKQKDGHFIGCIRDVTFGGSLLEFAKATKREVRLTGCSMKEGEAVVVGEEKKEEEKEETKEEEEAPLPPTTTLSRTADPEAVELPEDDEEEPTTIDRKYYPDVCALGDRAKPSLKKGTRFGTVPYSRLEYEAIPLPKSEGNELSLSVRVEGAFGPLFYASNKEHTDYLGLFLSHGRVVLVFNTGAGRQTIESKSVVLDGRWHHIATKRKGNYGQLIVDDEVSEGNGEKDNDSVDFSSPIYIGGVPNTTNIQHLGLEVGSGPARQRFEIMGCIRDVELWGMKLEKAKEIGVKECGESDEKGLYLGEKGGYSLISYTEPIDVLHVEMLFRSRVHDGLLFSMGKVDHIGLFLRKGIFHFTLTTAAGDSCTATFNPGTETSICDGHWHHLRLYRKKRLLTIALDQKSNMTLCHGVKGLDFAFNDPMIIGQPVKGMVHDDLLKHEPYIGCVKVLNESMRKKKRKRRDEVKYNEYETFEEMPVFGDARKGCPVA